MSSKPERSPVCSKALTLKELKRLPANTEVVLFCWLQLGRPLERLRLVYDGRAFRHFDGTPYDMEPYDDGLEPDGRVGWNSSNCIVLASDVRYLPTGPYLGKRPGDELRM